MGRYDASQVAENQFEPGSRGRVLKNLLGIRDKREIDCVEAEALKRATDTFIRTYDAQHLFTARDICKIHEVWLGGIYPWAGRYRQVNLGKGGFQFASAAYIPKLMEEFEQGPLREYTPCRSGAVEKIAYALAVVHTECVLIHPFREGNGRIARLLASLMALQAELPLLDFGLIKGKKRQGYFVSVQAGIKEDYKPMARIFSEVIQKTLTGPAKN